MFWSLGLCRHARIHLVRDNQMPSVFYMLIIYLRKSGDILLLKKVTDGQSIRLTQTSLQRKISPSNDLKMYTTYSLHGIVESED